MGFEKEQGIIEGAVQSKSMLFVLGDCSVEYWGRAASKLGAGKRLLLVKGDGSFAIHQNKFLRPVNYMMNAVLSCTLAPDKLTLIALKEKPKETLKVTFSSIDFCQAFPVSDASDLRLFGSEAELQKLIAEDLSFIEPGLKPLQKEANFPQGFPDFIAVDKNGRLVIIEVKRRKASLDAVSQLQRYREKLKHYKGSEVRAMLLAPSITENALKLLHDYNLEFAKFDFEVGNPKARIKGLEKRQTKLV